METELEMEMDSPEGEAIENEMSESPTEDQGTPPVVQPNADQEELKLLRIVAANALAAQQREEAYVKELAELRKPKEVPQEEEPLPDKESNPIDYMLAVNRRELSQLEKRMLAQVTPLHDVVQGSQHQQAYASEASKLIGKYPKLTPKFFEGLYGELGSKFDVRNLEAAALAKYGHDVITGVPDVNNPPPPTPTPNIVTPPRAPNNLPPSGETPSKVTEGERRSMKAMKLDPVKPDDVKRFREYMSQNVRHIDMGYES